MENDTFLKKMNKCDINIIADIVDIFFSSAENQKFFKDIFRKDVAKIFKKLFFKNEKILKIGKKNF